MHAMNASELHSGAVEAHGRLIQGELERRWSSEGDALGSMCQYALAAPGKLIRPILLLESAAAVGCDIGRVLPAAVGTESGHVASLVHDDIIDSDEVRRGRASVYHKFGINNAIVVGDALIFDLFLGLAECQQTGVPADRIVAALGIVARSGVKLCRGQSLESEITEKTIRDVGVYIGMIRMKTAALFQGVCESGAVLGGGPPEWVGALGSYGDHLGIAFQIHDDLLGYISDSNTAGKDAASDIRNARLTLPVVLAYQRGGATDRELLDEALSGEIDPAEAVPVVGELLTRTGSIAASSELAREHASAAQRAIAVLPATPSRERLAHFADRAITRMK